MSPSPDSVPSYEALVGVWKLGHDLGIEGLCERTLASMEDCRRITQHIPATPLLVQVWKDTPEGSAIRTLLLGWAAEYMRSSDSRTEFARSLPQEVLSELVVTMSSLDSPPPPVQVGAAGAAGAVGGARKNVHYRDAEDGNLSQAANAKRQRHSDVLPNGAAAKGGAAWKGGARTSFPGPKPGPKRRAGGAPAGDLKFSPDQKLNFCSDLITRMLSGPGKRRPSSLPVS